MASQHDKHKMIRLEQSLADTLDLLTIRDRKIELQAKEIELLKKLLALKYQPKDLDPRDREPDKYPKYDEFIRRP